VITRRVVIGFPSYDGKVEVHFAFAYGETVRLGCQRGIDVQMRCRAYDATLSCARNDVLRDAVEADCDDLIFIDADEEWQPELVFRLLAHPVDVVGAPVVNKADSEGYNVRSTVVPIPRDPQTGLLMPDGGCGTGFLRLSRKAIDAVRASSPVYKDKTRLENRWVFETALIGGEKVTEDYVLMNKLKALGFTTYLDDAMTVAHIGAKRWQGDFAAWLQRLEAAGVAAPQAA
jgi:glycosyltransferase involved in cell wall biosynthesis